MMRMGCSLPRRWLTLRSGLRHSLRPSQRPTPRRLSHTGWYEDREGVTTPESFCVDEGFENSGGDSGGWGFHTMLDGELYLPEKTWYEDRDRCQQANIPDGVVYRPKHQIAFEQYQRAVCNGIRFTWMTFDEFYGRSRGFLRDFESCGQNYVSEVPVDFTAWTKPPDLLYRDHARDKKTGRPRRYPRLKVKNNPRVEARNILRYSPIMRKKSWQTYHVKDGSKGPMVWRAKHMMVYLPDEKYLPTSGGTAHHLLIAQNVLNLDEVKYFISNAPPSTPIETLLKVAFSRWTIERVFKMPRVNWAWIILNVASSTRFNVICCLVVSAILSWPNSVCNTGGKNPALTVCQVRTATSSLAPLWAQGGRCSRKRAELIAAQLALTQHRNAKAARSHRKRTIRRLHAIGVKLKTINKCHWTRL
jgi:hypothetical protein